MYISQEDLDAAIRWIDQIEAAVALLAERPRVGRRRIDLGEGLRSYPTAGHVIVYRPLENGVRILRVLHGSRDIEREIQ